MRPCGGRGKLSWELGNRSLGSFSYFVRREEPPTLASLSDYGKKKTGTAIRWERTGSVADKVLLREGLLYQ